MGLLDFLKLPDLDNVQDLDAPETTLLHRRIIQSKPFLKKLYLEFYRYFERNVADFSSKTCVELGSGGGFLKEVYPFVTTSDVLPLAGVDLCFSGLAMPFKDQSVDAFLMIDVFHHVPDSEKFLSELRRCLKPGGQILMIEPANTLWGRFIYRNFHHEAFEPTAGWKLEGGGPLSCANGALPWIVFKRDRQIFKNKFPELRLTEFSAHTPLRYLLSGGVSMRQLVPSISFGFFSGVEWLLGFMAGLTGMFYRVHIRKRPVTSDYSGA